MVPAKKENLFVKACFRLKIKNNSKSTISLFLDKHAQFGLDFCWKKKRFKTNSKTTVYKFLKYDKQNKKPELSEGTFSAGDKSSLIKNSIKHLNDKNHHIGY